MMIQLSASQAATVRAALQCLAENPGREALIDAVTDEGRCAALPVEEYGAVLTPLTQADALFAMSRTARKEVGDAAFNALRDEAENRYAVPSDNDIEIDDAPILSEAKGGTWVSAWVWVPGASDDDAEKEVQAEREGELA